MNSTLYRMCGNLFELEGENIAGIANISPGDYVKKIGRTTGLTEGIVSDRKRCGGRVGKYRLKLGYSAEFPRHGQKSVGSH